MEKRELLGDIKNQIVSFDNKASILLTVNGFILAFTTSFTNLLEPYKGIDAQTYDARFYISVLAIILYFISLLVSGGLFVSVIFPRKRLKNVLKSNNYYIDIARMKYEDCNKDEKEDRDINSQIWMNSKICSTKHRLIVIGSYTLGVSAICFLMIISLLIF